MNLPKTVSFVADIAMIFLLGIVYVAGLTAKTLGSYGRRSWSALGDQLSLQSVERSPRR
jgi:hypothetical protein